MNHDFWRYLVVDMEDEEIIPFWRFDCSECDGGQMVYRGAYPTFGGAIYVCTRCGFDEWFYDDEDYF